MTTSVPVSFVKMVYLVPHGPTKNWQIIVFLVVETIFLFLQYIRMCIPLEMSIKHRDIIESFDVLLT